MDQRVYYGNINPHALADYLVTTFQQPGYSQAWPPARVQKVMQGERIYVQIMQEGGRWSGGHQAIGVQIVGIAGGVSVTLGASDWLNIDETGLTLGLLGALFFPPLLLFPLLQGLAGSGLSNDVWTTIDTYCAQPGQGSSRTQPGFYCTYCGAFNHPGAPCCHGCHAPFNVAQTQPAGATPSSKEQPPAEQQPQQAEANEVRKTGETRPMFALMTCPSCKATVVRGRFCSNCAVPLSNGAEQKAGEEET